MGDRLSSGIKEAKNVRNWARVADRKDPAENNSKQP
jgi:hypothetical protein